MSDGLSFVSFMTSLSYLKTFDLKRCVNTWHNAEICIILSIFISLPSERLACFFQLGALCGTAVLCFHCSTWFHLNRSLFVISEIMVNMGYNRKDIEESLRLQKYDDIQACYLLLGRRTSDVSSVMFKS